MSPKLVPRSQRSFARGMNNTASFDEFRPDEVEAMYNARVSYSGDAAERRGGSQRTHSSALNSGAQVQGAVEFYDASATRFLILVAGTVAYKSTNDGVTWTSIKTGLSAGGWCFTTMQSGASRLLIGVNGSGAPQKFDGSTWADLTGTSIPSNATMCQYHNNRLWLWGHSNDLMVGSVVDTPTDFSSANGGVTIRIEITQGDPTPRGLWSQNTALLAFSWEQVGYVEGWGLNTVQVNTGHRGLSKSLGCVSHRTIAQIGETGLIWLSRLGFVYMEQGRTPELISDQIQPFLDALAWDNIAADRNLPTATFYGGRHEYHCAVPAAGNSQNTHVVVIRPARLGRPLAIWIERAEDTSGSAFAITDGVLELTGGGDREAIITGGVFGITASGVPGIPVGIVAGVLETITNDFVPAAFFAADDDANNASDELWSGGYDGFVRRHEIGDLDDVLSDDTGGAAVNAWVRTRPETHRDQFRNKRVRSARITVKATAGGTLGVYPVGDSVIGALKTETLLVKDGLQVVKSRVSSKGVANQLDLRFTDAIKIQGVELSAEILRESP